MVDFVKLSSLVNSEFTVLSVGAFQYKKWDDANHKMLVSPSYEKEFRKLYPVVTDKGQLDMGPGQLGNLLEAVFTNGRADLINRTFAVKSNGKSGMDIRYFLNPAKTAQYELLDGSEPLPEFPEDIGY